MTHRRSIRVFIFALCSTLALGFHVPSTSASSRKSSLGMAPKYDKSTQLWSPSSSDEEASAGYDKVGTLLRHGPLPFIQRVFKEGEYEQGVYKFMAKDDCDRNVAQGNMDAYIKNPNDWAFTRLECERKGTIPDYVTLRTKEFVLTTIWGSFVLSLAGRGIYCLQSGTYFWAFLSFMKTANDSMAM